ncbi:ATP-dependent RNA helicase [Venturia nashicola]|nr:ATP-dependent RNA helicase [Venturia nashicola]
MPKRKSKLDEYEDDEDEPVTKKRSKAATKEAKPVEKPEQKTDDQGRPYWELSSKRRLGISEFKGNTSIAIREYYEKDGKMLPGKTGINLNIEQLTALLLALPEVTAALAQKGLTIPRPDYDGPRGGLVEPEAEKEAKRNFDATSDEEEE